MTKLNTRAKATALAVIVSLATSSVLAQTPVKLPKNKYTPQQDVELGREGAAEVHKEYPIIEDEQISKYLAKLGDRLVAAAPKELNNPVYKYSFTPVNERSINAFALPGGPMFVNRGMFDAAAKEGEVVGVMAHELSHVLLRHGTANVSKSQNPLLQLGQIASAIGGAMVGGAAGSAIQQGGQFGLGTLMLRYSRDFEKQADILGSQIMAKAGYDPRDLAHMFQTIQEQSEGGNPQWMSSHPNPGNRTAYITQEASLLTIAAPVTDVDEFQRMKAKFASIPAPAGKGRSGAANAPENTGTIGKPVPAPSTEFRAVRGGNLFQASIPTNWQAITAGNSVKFVPENAYGQQNGEEVFTHGVQFGIVPANSRDLRQATKLFLEGVAPGNPELRLAGDQVTVKMSGRDALGTPLTNKSVLGGTERIGLYTTFLADGNLFYYLGVAPENVYESYRATFNKVGQSIRLTDVK
ncbi:MAG TPA: M48 family metallopeptidase [Terriglobia bacterium]|nr:M48 family metallopeptidase [Terriglobia bacterium]